jgi:hypothetical protein
MNIYLNKLRVAHICLYVFSCNNTKENNSLIYSALHDRVGEGRNI